MPGQGGSKPRFAAFFRQLTSLKPLNQLINASHHLRQGGAVRQRLHPLHIARLPSNGIQRLFHGAQRPVQLDLAGTHGGDGRMYYNGQGLPKDDQQAVAWYRKAAEQGHALEQYLLGNMYAFGNGVPKDEQEAAAWYRKAAEQGDDGAQNSLGKMYDNGRGVPKDAQSAYSWWLLASAQGNQKATKNRDLVERSLSPGQRATAQTDARDWKPKTPAQSSKL